MEMVRRAKSVVSPLTLLILGLACAIIFLVLRARKERKAKRTGWQINASNSAQGDFTDRDTDNETDKEKTEEPTEYPSIEPLPDLDWSTTEPIQLRPWAPQYHLTMGLKRLTASELFEMDWTYVDRMKLRRQIMDDHADHVLGAEEETVKPAVDEFYTWLMGTYLPTRFPRMFTLTAARDQDDAGNALTHWPPGQLQDAAGQGNEEKHTHLLNHAIRELTPLAPPESPLLALRTLGGIVDYEFAFLLPSSDSDNHTLKGFVLCFPNGFDTDKKLNMKPREIHKPVPHYSERLEKSVDRFFDGLAVGRFVKRVNWAISTDGVLYVPEADAGILEDPDSEEAKADCASVDLLQCYQRTELQTLHRLPHSRAVLFSFKTYMYPLTRHKEEGSAESLADAIEGVSQGKAPGMRFYKKTVVWQNKVCAWLRGKLDDKGNPK